MASNKNTQFVNSINNFIRKTEGNISYVRKQSAIDLFSKIIDRTPVSRIEFVDQDQQGVAKGGWAASINTPDFGGVGNDPEGQMTIDAMRSTVMAATLKDDIYLSNDVSYIGLLEYGGYPSPVENGSWNRFEKRYEKLSDGGYSLQAPNGWVRLTLMEWPKIVSEQAKMVVK